MPDFDKNLEPIIKPSVLKTELPLNPLAARTPQIPTGPGLNGNPFENQPGNGGTFGYFADRSMKKGPYSDPYVVTTGDFLGSTRWGFFNRDVANPEEYKNRTQSTADQWANAAVKTGALALGTFFQTFNYLPKTATAAKEGSQLAGLGSYESDIDQFYDNMENRFPNYMSQYEKDHPFKAFFGGQGFANMWGNTIMKNSAFIFGTLGGMLVQDALLAYTTQGLGIAPALASQLGKLSFAVSKIAAGTTRADRAIESAIGLGKSAQQIARIEDIYKAAEGARLINKARWGLNLYGASLTEAGIEAREGYKTLMQDLEEQYRFENFGAEPDERTKAEFRKTAEAGMNARLGINMALLLVSNAIQWDNMLRPFSSAKWGMMSTLDNKVYTGLSKLGMKSGSLDELETVASKSFKNTLLKGTAKAAPSMFSEGIFEEGLQFATQKGTEDYFFRRYNAEKDPDKKESWNTVGEIIRSTVKGLGDQFGTTEGQENMFVGAVIGGFGAGARVAFESKEEKDQKRKQVEYLNKFPLTGVIDSKINEAVNTVDIKKGLIQAVKNNNVFEYKNLKFKEFFNFIQSGINTGRFDLRMEQLKALKELSPEQFQSLFGIEFSQENKKLVSDYADALINKAEDINDLYKSVNSVYEMNPFRSIRNPKTEAEQIENKRYQTYEQWKTELVYQLAIGKDSKKRMNELEQEIGAIAPVSRDVLIKLSGRDVKAEDIIDTLAKESNAQIPKEKEGLLVKMVRDYNALDSRDKRASALYDNLSDPKGTFKYFEDAMRDLFEEAKKAGQPKEKIVATTKEGEFEFEVGQEYVATSAKDRKKQEALFGEKGRFVFLGMAEDGKFAVSLRQSGETLNISADDMANLAFISVPETQKSDNARLFLEVASEPFHYRVTKDGDPLTGFLEYNGFTNQLVFRTMDGKKAFTVTRDQFLAKGEEPAQITLVEGQFNQQVLAALSVPVTEAEILQKFQQKTQIIAEATTETQKRLEEVNKELEIARAEYARVVKALNEILTTKAGEARKRITEEMRKNISSLNKIKEKLEKDVLSLEEEQEELQNVMSYLKDLMTYKETLPDNYDELFKELKDEMDRIKEIVDLTTDGIKTGNKLIEDTTDALVSAFRTLRDYIIKEREQNPETPFFSERLQELLDSFLEPNGIDGLSSKKDTLTALLVEYEDFKKGLLPENIKSIPNMTSKLEQLQKQVLELADGLAEMYDIQQKKAIPLKGFQALAKSYERRVKQEMRFRRDSKLISEVLSTMSSELHSLARSEKDPDPSTKKDEAVIPNATIVPSEEFSLATLAEHHLRSNFFGATFYDMEEVDKVRAIIVTRQNEAAVGIPGLTDRLVADAMLTEPEYLKKLEVVNEKIRKAIDDGTIDEQADAPYDKQTWRQVYEAERNGLDKKRATKVDVNSIIALVFVKESTDGKTRTFIDAYGKPIEGPVTPDNAVYQVMPLEDLRWSNGVSMFRNNVPESRQLYIREKYKQWREQTLKNPPTRGFKVSPSSGIANLSPKLDAAGKPVPSKGVPIEDAYNMFSVTEAGLVKSDDQVNQFATTNLIYVNTLNQYVSKGYSTFVAKLGSVFLNLANKYVPLYGRKLTLNESITMYKVLKRFAELAEDGKLKSVEGQRLTNWLRSVVYWGIPSKEAAANSVWFQKAPKGGLNLYVGKDGAMFPFTPEGIENNRDQIIATLQSVYNNIDAKKASDFNQTYEEIIDIDDNGQPVIRMVDGKPYWPNYQTWALSDKGRTKEEIPFKTLYTPPKPGPWGTNVEGVYFVIEDNEFKYEQAPTAKKAVKLTPTKKAEPTKKGEPAKQKKSLLEMPPTKQTGKVDMTGKTWNSFNLFDQYTVRFKYNGQTPGLPLNLLIEIDDADKDFLNIINYVARLENGLPNYQTPSSTQKQEAVVSLIQLIDKYTQVVKMMEDQKKAGKPVTPAPTTAATFTPTTPYGTPTGPELTTAISDKKADIERRRQEEIKNLPEGTKSSLKPLLDEVNAKYDAELARELYKEMKAGKLVTDMTPAEQAIADKYITEELRKSVDAEEVTKVDTPPFDVDPGPKPSGTLPTAGSSTASDEQTNKYEDDLENNDFGGPDEVLREKVKHDMEAYTGERWERVGAWLAENFPNIPVYRVQNMLRSIDGSREAWGMLKDGAIYVYEGAEEGTVYHEVFEAVWKALLSPEERAELATEFRSRKGTFEDRVTLEEIKYSEATDAQLKEELAEEFRRYVLDKQAPPKPAKGISLIAKAFKDLVETIKTFFLGNKGRSNTEKLFKKINEGKYKSFVPFADQLSFAKMGFLSVEEAYITQGAELRVPGLSENQVHDLMQSMTYSTIKKLIKEDRGIFQIDSVNKNENYLGAWNDVKANILALIKQAKNDFESKTYKTEKDRELAKKDYEAYKKKNFDFLATIENNWPALEKRHLEVLKSYNIEFDEEENSMVGDEEMSKMQDWVNPMLVDNYRKLSTAVRLFLSTIPVVNENRNMVRSSVNGPVLLPTSQAYIGIMNKVHNATDPEDMLERVRQMAMKDPVYISVYERLTKSDFKKENGINWDGLDEHHAKLITSMYVVFSKQQPDVRNLYILAEGAVQVGSANFSNLVAQFTDEMETGLNLAVRKENSFFVYSNESKGFVLRKGKKGEEPILPKQLRNMEERISFLNTLNIVFSQDELLKLSPNSPLLSKFKEATDGIFRSVYQAERIVSINKKVFKISTRLRELAEVKAALKNPEFSSTFFGIEGQKKQSFLGHNAISRLQAFLLKAKNIRDLANTPYKYLFTKEGTGDAFSKNSVYLNKMFDAQSGEKKAGFEDMLKFSIAEGTDNNVNGKRKDSASLNYRERLVQEMNMNLEGYHYVLVPGDASIEAMWRTGQAVTYEEMTSGFGVIYNIFQGYLESEIELAREKRDIVIPKGSGRKNTDLRFFKPILSQGLHDEIVKAALEETEKEPSEIYADFKPRVDAAVRAFLEEKADNTFNLLKTYDLANTSVSETMIKESVRIPDKDRMWETPLVDFNEGRPMTFDTLMLNILTREANYIINNIEAHKVVFADPYQYSDELKRIKNALSPKKAVMSGAPNMNSVLNRIWNKNYEDAEDIGRTDFTKDSFTTVTATDVNGFSELADYGVFDKTDGAGIINFKSHRELRIREGNWNDAEEMQYAYDIAWEKKDKGLPLTDKDKAALKKNPDVASAYTPVKPLVFGSMIRDNNNNIILDKFALYPISYRVQKEFDEVRGNGESNMLKLYNKMQKEKADYVVFKSGRKVGGTNTFDLYTDEGALNQEPFTPEQRIELSFANIYIQADVPSKKESETGRATQATKLVTLDMMEGGIPVDYKPEVEDFGARYEAWMAEKNKEAASPLYKEIKNNERLLKEITLDGYNKLLNKLGIKELPNKRYEVKDGDYTRVAEAIRNQMLRQEININISTALDDLIKGSVVAEATPAYQQIRNILYSIVDSQVIRPDITGGMKVQLPVVLMESKNVKVMEVNGKKAYVSDELKMYEKDGEKVMQVYMARWFDSELSDKELLNYLNKTEEGKRILRGIAFRIPTQRQNSIDRIEIAGFLPKQYKDSVIVPEALVKKAGSDFDIDKLTVYLKSVYTNEQGKPVEIPFLGYGEPALQKFREKFKAGEFNKQAFALLNDDSLQELARILDEEKQELIDTPAGKLLYNLLGDGFEKEITADFIRNMSPKAVRETVVRKLYTKSLQNAYVQSMENLVASKENYSALIKPNSSKDLADLSQEVYEATGNKRIDYTSVGNMLDSSFMSKLRHFFVAGKYAIGIAAVNQTNQSLMQRVLSYIDVEKIKDQPYQDRLWLGDGSISLRHNSVNHKGMVRPTFSMIKNRDGEVITEIISQFIDGYVDISKGPWIMELGAFPNVASTYLFLVKIGVPIKTVAYFMNQPIIRDYLKTIENSGYSWLFIEDSVVDVVNDPKYSEQTIYQDANTWLKSLNTANKEGALVMSDTAQGEAKTSELEDMVGKSSFTKEEKMKQQFALAEFLKYAKMASQLFEFTQGSNFDTSNFNDPYLVFKKMLQRKKAQAGIISSVEEVLDNSFVGDLADKIVNSRDALAQVLISDKNKVREVAEKILSRYTSLNDRDFVKVARKVVSDLFDWAVQTSDKTHLNQALASTLTSETAAALEMQEFMKEVQADPTHPLHHNDIVKEGGFLRVLPSANPRGIVNFKGINKDNKIYDQNQIIHSFRELRDYLGTTSNLYKNLVVASVLQSGVTNSPISFTSMLPYEDFKDIYNDVLKDLELMNVEDFYNSDSFERNNWANDDLIPHSYAKYVYVNTMLGVETVYNPGMYYLDGPIKKAIKDKKIPQLITISTLSQQGRSEFIVHSWESQRFTKAEKARMKKEGDFSYINRGLFKRVKKEDGSPYSYLNNNGREYGVYKMINAWGDSFRAKEFYEMDRESVFDNGYLKSFDVDDRVILSYFGVAQNKAIPGMKPMAMGKDNVARIEAGLKTTTVRSTRESQNLGIPYLESAEKIIGDKVYVVTHRGLMSVNDAGGAAAMVKSEGLPTEPTEENKFSVTVDGVKYYTKYNQTAMWLRGTGKMHVYDIRPATNVKMIREIPAVDYNDLKLMEMGAKEISKSSDQEILESAAFRYVKSLPGSEVLTDEEIIEYLKLNCS